MSKFYETLDSAYIIVTGCGRKSIQLLVYHLINVKSALKGTYHAIQSRHLPRYLAELNIVLTGGLSSIQ
jgi:hypothetical protein